MGYGVYNNDGVRWCGYMVPAECDWPSCTTRIDRGLGYKCDEHVWYEEPDDDDDIEHIDEGCGLYFCEAHRYKTDKHAGIEPKPDLPEWLRWMLMDGSWSQWRNEYPNEVRAAQRALRDAV